MKCIKSNIRLRKIGMRSGILFQKAGIRNGYVFAASMARPRPKSDQVHPPGSIALIAFLESFLSQTPGIASISTQRSLVINFLASPTIVAIMETRHYKLFSMV